MPLLRTLRLTGTHTTGATVQALSPSKTLRVLAVAQASADALAPLRQRGVRIYEAANGQ
jgi:hypothetical protein